MCAYCAQYRDGGGAKEILKNGIAVNAACQGNFFLRATGWQDILSSTATAIHRRTPHYREFGSPKLTRFKLAVGRSAIPTAHNKSPLVLQESMLPISQCEFHSGSTGIASRPAVLRREFPQDNTETAYCCQFLEQ